MGTVEKMVQFNLTKDDITKVLNALNSSNTLDPMKLNK
jgi:hypothetical protein